MGKLWICGRQLLTNVRHLAEHLLSPSGVGFAPRSPNLRMISGRLDTMPCPSVSVLFFTVKHVEC